MWLVSDRPFLFATLKCLSSRGSDGDEVFLLVHEQALGIAYTEEVSLAALLPAAAASALLPPVEAGGVSGADKIATAVAASGVVQRSLWLHGLHSLRLLDRVHGTPSGPSSALNSQQARFQKVLFGRFIPAVQWASAILNAEAGLNTQDWAGVVGTGCQPLLGC